jgi:crotonobetainyl-CoA:carnitine CoA-transferase CaiB-like acyl-CoA transferase
MGILSGYRVLDCSIAMAGPFAAQRLGDLGADVIKIEPTSGEWQRHAPAGGAKGNRINVSFLSLNRNKRSLSIDLKSEAGKKILFDLVASADIFLQNYRAGVAERLGVDYAALKAIKPDIIYVSITGFGESGPYIARPGQDLLLQAMSGAMFSSGRAGDPPVPAGEYLVDAVTASTAFEGALAALLHRERTGEGQLVQVNMLDAIIAHQIQELSVYTVGGVPQKRTKEPHGHCYIRAPYGVFKTTDGYIALAMPNMKVLGEVLNVPEFLDLPETEEKPEDRDWVFAKTREALLERPTDESLKMLGDAGIWVAPVYDYEAVVNDPQVIHNGSFVEYEHPTEGKVKTPGFPYKFSATPCAVEKGAPLTGEHTKTILNELGYSTEEVNQLLHDKIVAESSP